MLKLVVLFSTLFIVATARPGYYEHGSPALYTAPAATIIHEPAYAKIGALVKTIPTAVSHQSQSIVHSSAHVVQPILAPILKTTTLLHAAPIWKTYAAPAYHHHLHHHTSYDAPLYGAHAAHDAPAPSAHSGWATAW